MTANTALWALSGAAIKNTAHTKSIMLPFIIVFIFPQWEMQSPAIARSFSRITGERAASQQAPNYRNIHHILPKFRGVLQGVMISGWLGVFWATSLN
jgi:hypothetical protein